MRLYRQDWGSSTGAQVGAEFTSNNSTGNANIVAASGVFNETIDSGKLWYFRATNNVIGSARCYAVDLLIAP